MATQNEEAIFVGGCYGGCCLLLCPRRAVLPAI
jgi:hypothetical protein